MDRTRPAATKQADNRVVAGFMPAMRDAPELALPGNWFLGNHGWHKTSHYMSRQMWASNEHALWRHI